jgi:hypothetical protein
MEGHGNKEDWATKANHGLLLNLLRETNIFNSMPYLQVELEVIIMVTMISINN